MFSYAINIDTSQPFGFEVSGALISGFVRHFNSLPVNFGLGNAELGQLKIGFRLYLKDSTEACFEDRAKISRDVVENGEAVSFEIKVPCSKIDVDAEYRLFVDLLREGDYWFSKRMDSGYWFNVRFFDAQDHRRTSIERAQGGTIDNLLAGAFARISELEYAERVLESERDEYRARLEALSERTSRQINALALQPPLAAQIDQAIRALDPIQRRDIWLEALSNLGASGSLFSLYPHDGQPGTLNILITGSGGFGDMVYLTTVIRELHQRFADCNIFVAHEHAEVDTVLGVNPYVSGAVAFKAETLKQFVQLVHMLDVFDLIVEVRYAVTYSAPPMSRVPTDFLLRANYSSAAWQKYVRSDWPHLNNLFANEVMKRGMGKLDLVGITSLLPINKESELDLFPLRPPVAHYPELVRQAYATVHHGADPRMASGTGLQTKNLPTSHWAKIVTRLSESGLKVVQLGDHGEVPIPGIHVDLRGRTSFLETAFIIKMAQVHVDTEGGLVHVARAMHNRSVVAFGPTPIKFFGYPQNVNLAPPACGNCWWVTKSWSITCPRELKVPECMEGHDPRLIADMALDLAKSSLLCQITHAVSVQEEQGGSDGQAGPASRPVIEILKESGPLKEEGLVFVGPQYDTAEVVEGLQQAGVSFTLLVPVEEFQTHSKLYGSSVMLRPISQGSVPINTGSRPWLLAFGLDLRNPEGAGFAMDLARCVAPGGRAYLVAVDSQQSLEIAAWMRHFQNAVSAMLGAKFLVSLPEDIESREQYRSETSYLLIHVAVHNGALPDPQSRKSLAEVA